MYDLDYYTDYGYTDYANSSLYENEILGALILLFLGIIFAAFLINIISQWKIFQKAGKPGWYSLIPFLNNYQLFEISGMKGWYAFLSLIPFFGSFIFLILYIILCTKLPKAFGKDSAFGIGLIFLPIIFYPILAFSKSAVYIGPNEQNQNMNNNTMYNPNMNNNTMYNPYNNQNMNNPYINQNIGPMGPIEQPQQNNQNTPPTTM